MSMTRAQWHAAGGFKKRDCLYRCAMKQSKILKQRRAVCWGDTQQCSAALSVVQPLRALAAREYSDRMRGIGSESANAHFACAGFVSGPVSSFGCLLAAILKS